MFASGKFDQYKRDIPYATLGPSLPERLSARFWAKARQKLGRWRDALREALGPNGQLIVEPYS